MRENELQNELQTTHDQETYLVHMIVQFDEIIVRSHIYTSSDAMMVD